MEYTEHYLLLLLLKRNRVFCPSKYLIVWKFPVTSFYIPAFPSPQVSIVYAIASTTRTDGAPSSACRRRPPVYQSFGQTAALRSILKRTRARYPYKNVELRVLRPQMIICSRVASHHCGRSDRWISPNCPKCFRVFAFMVPFPGTWPSM